MIALTGATGQLGRLAIANILSTTPASQVVAAVRQPAKAADLAMRGVQVRRADYNDPAALAQALTGVERLLLISSSEVGQRTAQHRNVVEAAQRQHVKLIVYTSLLRADTSPLNLAGEHRETEALIKASGIPYAILRNGWYAENHTGSIPVALAQGAVYGSAGEGRIAWATRADYAEAAARVVTAPIGASRTYELAGDTAHTLTEFAAELSRQSGKAIPYRDIPAAAYTEALRKAGLPEWLASGVASWDAEAARGALFDESRQLSRLIGRPTTSLVAAIQAGLKK
ncbi:MAG TPA: SDR family oxidoreductase [Opitutaceae bacterium]